jgi:hypothetical protein
MKKALRKPIKLPPCKTFKIGEGKQGKAFG